jgi:chaperonin GroEL
MSREVLSGNEIRQRVLVGVNTLADAVKATLGPKGRNVILERNPIWAPLVTKDGVTVAKEIRDLACPYANAGAHLIRQAASKTSDDAGDGTTTSTLLAQVIYQKGLEALSAGANPVALKRGIDSAVSVVVEHIKAIAQPVSDDETIIRVGTISSNGDRSIGEMIAEAMRRVGRDGVITISEASDAETTLQVVEGMQIDRGWLAYPFITDPERLEAVLNDPYILLTERKLFTMTPELDVVLAQVGQAGKPVLVIAGDYDQPFVISLIHNNQVGMLRSVAVKAPAFGDLRRAILEDMATVTGAYAFTEDCGRPLSTITIEDLGRAVRVTCGQNHTTIAGGYGNEEAKTARMTLLRSLIEATENDLDRERLRQRLARLAAGVAVIRVGAVTEAEQREKQDRVDDAVCATKAAVEEGIVPGGGKALISALGEFFRDDSIAGPDESAGIAIVRQAIAAPMWQIAENAGLDPDEIVLEASTTETNWGFDAATEKWGNLIEIGVIDPAKVVRCALQNAASVAALLLTTAAMVAEVRKP